jgi:hypothetical protein
MANAQDNDRKVFAELGFRLMPTFTAIDMQTSTGGTVSGNAVLGFGIGALAAFNITRFVGIQGELIYSSISQKSYDLDVERKINLRYVNVPILLSLNTGKANIVNLNVVAGPQIGFNVGSKMVLSGTNDVNNPQPVLLVKKNDLGFAYGAGIDFGITSLKNTRLSLGYRGVLGLLDISNKSESATTNSYYVLGRTHLKTNAAYIGLSIIL